MKQLQAMLGCVLWLWASGACAQSEMQYHYIHSGTGFFVNREYIITNAHVVRGCSKVDLQGVVTARDADVIIADDEHDLALIHSETESSTFAPLRTDIDDLRVGDNVMIAGYPGQSGMNGQQTIVKAQVQKLGMNVNGNTWQFYISNVVQHGNSGGPVLDSAGNVIGVVVGMMQLSTVNSLTKERISQEELGAVISLKALERFIEDHGVFVQWGGASILQLPDDNLADRAKSYIVNVQCHIDTNMEQSGFSGEGAE